MRRFFLLAFLAVVGAFSTSVFADDVPAPFSAGPATRQAGAARGASSAPERFTVQSDGHPMAVWARRPATPRAAILLVHGRTWSSRPDFDLQVPGMKRSVMADLAALGIAAYAVDLRGYGETPRDSTGWLTPRRSASDVIAVLTWIAQQHPTLAKPALLGWSRGGAVAQLVAQQAPTKISSVMLFGFLFDPDLEFADGEVTEKPQMAKNTVENAGSDFISPTITPQAVVRAFVEQAMKADPVMVDLKGDGEFNVLKPQRVTVPTLVMYGEDDPGISHADAGKFFSRLAAHDRQMVVLPGADHAAQLEDTHDMWIAAVANFMNRPGVKR